MAEDFPSRLKRSRKKMGLTQRELAAKLGIVHTSITHFEKRTRAPSEEIARKLAKIFQEDEGEWVVLAGPAEKIRKIVEETIKEHPKQLSLLANVFNRATAPQKDAQGEGSVRLSASDYQRLSEEMEQCASSVLREVEVKFKTTTTPPIPVDRIAEELFGLKIKRNLRTNKVIGRIIVEDQHILLRQRNRNAKNESPPNYALGYETLRENQIETGFSERERFTIAHELGHFILHNKTSKDKSIQCSSKDTSISEREADKFAASLLMPRRLFYKHLILTISELYPREDFYAIQFLFNQLPDQDLDALNRLIFSHISRNSSNTYDRKKLLEGITPGMSTLFQVSKESMRFRIKGFGLLEDILK